MVEASLQQFRQVVVLRGADEAGYRGTGQRTAARVQIVQQYAECFWIEFYYGELKIKMKFYILNVTLFLSILCLFRVYSVILFYILPFICSLN